MLGVHGKKSPDQKTLSGVACTDWAICAYKQHVQIRQSVPTNNDITPLAPLIRGESRVNVRGESRVSVRGEWRGNVRGERRGNGGGLWEMSTYLFN